MSTPTEVLAFCRRHDWGREAHLVEDLDGEPLITGLVAEEITPGGDTVVDIATIRATMQAARQFGAY